MTQVSERKEKLIEELGMYFEDTLQIPPLAARIFALLRLCPESGHSFDEIIELSKSSKSSVSTNIKLLLERGSIKYFTKCGERKRYFQVSKNHLVITLTGYKERVDKELMYLQQVTDFNHQYNPINYEKNRYFGRQYQQYLETQLQNLEDTINKMNQLKNEDYI